MLYHLLLPIEGKAGMGSVSYHGLDSSEIVAKYWELNNDGLPPTQGDRNTKIFDLACSLRHIFGFDREQLNRAIPNYEGFPQEEKMQCIHNAIREPRKYMPMKLTKVLQALKAEHAENPDFVAEKHFLAHPDSEISRLAADLCGDRYILSNLFAVPIKYSNT